MTKRFIYLIVIILMVMNSQVAEAQDEKETLVLIETDMGKIKVKLYNDTPLHRDNFIKNVKEHLYDGLLFHRVIRQFMVQAGDILGYMGNTGYGPKGTKGRFPVHLHMGIYIKTPKAQEMSVDPYHILKILQESTGRSDL